MPTKERIEAMMDQASASKSKFDMTYQQGIEAALRWVINPDSEPPLAEGE